MIYICARSTRDKQNKSTQDNVCVSVCVCARPSMCVYVVLEMLCVWWVGGSGCGCTASIQMHIYCGCSCCGACCCLVVVLTLLRASRSFVAHTTN